MKISTWSSIAIAVLLFFPTLISVTQGQGIKPDTIQGINFYGLETPSKDFVCSWQHPPTYYLDKLHDIGFNAVRLPFSYEWVGDNDFSKMDYFFTSCEARNMTIILDMHRVWSSHQGPNPTEGISMNDFIQRWITVMERYVDRPILTGIDIFNEDQNTDPNEWNNILRQIATALENRFPGRFTYFCGGTRWGGDISGINIEDVPFHDRVIYTIHKYTFSSSGNYIDDWNYSFGPFADVPGKVSVGEFGWKQDMPDQVSWATQFIDYLKKRNIGNDFFWTVALSGDTSGLWQDDCETFQYDKWNLLKTLWDDEERKRMLRGGNKH